MGGNSITELELALAAITLAWLALIWAMKACYDRIKEEEMEVRRISESIDRTQELIDKFERGLVALTVLRNSA